LLRGGNNQKEIKKSAGGGEKSEQDVYRKKIKTKENFGVNGGKSSKV
jgi:hypothetical protein